jgi:mannose-6-phosphate isomerase class I
MFNPHPFDDPKAVNKIKLEEKTIKSVITGTKKSAEYFAEFLQKSAEEAQSKVVIAAVDGYISARTKQFSNMVSQHLSAKQVKIKVIDFTSLYKASEVLEKELTPYLEENREKDPVLLFGKLFKGKYEDLVDATKLASLRKELEDAKKGGKVAEVIVVTGCGAALDTLRPLYNTILFMDVTPKKAILRGKEGEFANIGDTVPKPVKALLRRCYYVDFEVAGHLRGELLKNGQADFYAASDDPENIKLIPKETLNEILGTLSKYPVRCKPVYIEGVWGGHYITKLRNLPSSMKNCAWVFDLIPLEVSIVLESGETKLEFPFFTFVQKEGKAIMGEETVKKFHGYFPVRFNYDDTFHSSGNMSIQVHSGHDYNIQNYGEYGRQDESYYVVATGHDAKTYVGFNENCDPDEFIALAKKSEKDFTPVDYEKYINYVESKPGVQVMLPAGTIHSSGRNQLILEIGSLTIGSYTYKMYDYLRADLDGKPRPIHTYHGERVLCKERKTNWVNQNIVQAPSELRKGDGWREYVVGDSDMLYFSLRRLEFEKQIQDNTDGVFHVLTLVDGERVKIASDSNPDYFFIQDYLDMVIVPANMGSYTITNLGNQPVCIHKTLVKKECLND